MQHMDRTRLEGAALQAELADLEGWVLSDDGTAITKTFAFADFAAAFGFMAQMALVAERMDHHPDWRNVYRRVEVSLTTHDRGGVTALDIALAKAMDRAAG